VTTKAGYLHSLGYLLLIVLLTGAPAGMAWAAGRSERTLAEIKAEALRRAKLGGYPVTGISPADLQRAFAAIHALHEDQWGPAFIAVGDRYMAEANRLRKSNPARADADYLKAWRIYSFGRWPVAWSPGRKRAYQKALEAYLAHARFLDPPLEVIRIPFAGSEVIAYMRLPKQRRGPVPLVLAIPGLDSRKETMAEFFSALLPHGIGFLAVDGPGTGQAPVKFTPRADRMFSRVLDYLQTRPEIDKTRIAVYGASLGAYWAAKLAITERARLRFVVSQSPGVHYFFQKKWILNSLVGNREYLYGSVPALMHIMNGVTTMSQLEAAFPTMSLLNQNLLGKASAPMLIIGGAKDTQVPIADTNLLLASGQSPKYAWINPAGGHMGRELMQWPDQKIFESVTLPWLVRELQPNRLADSDAMKPVRK